MLDALSVLAAEAGEGNGFWLPADINEVIWGSISFAVVAIILVKFTKAPIAKALSGRTEQIATELSEAHTLRTDAEAQRAQVAAALADRDTAAAQILAEAQETAERVKADIVARAEVEAAALSERAEHDIETAKRQAIADLTGEVARLALGAAEEVVEHNLDAPTHQQLIEAYISKVGAP